MTNNLTESLLQSILKLQGTIIHQSKLIAYEHDLSMPQFLILTILGRKGALPQKFLQKKSRLPKSTLSYVIDGLAKEEIVMRTIAEDNRRESIIILTDTGRALLQSFREDTRSAESKLSRAIENIGQEKIEDLLHLHGLLIESLEDKGDKI